MRFDAPKAKIRRSWPGVRGTLSSTAMKYKCIVITEQSDINGIICSDEGFRFFKSPPVCVFLTRHDLASLCGVPSDLGLHAVHSSDL